MTLSMEVSHPEQNVSGQPTRITIGAVVTVNDDGSIDVQPLSSRATKSHVQCPTWWIPRIGERCLLADRDGDARTPICLGYFAPADGALIGPQLRATITAPSLPDASATSKGVVRLSEVPAGPTDPIAVGDNDARVPTQAENNALLGTFGSPGSANKYVTDADARNTNARTPSGAAGGVLGGTYPNPGFAVDMATQAELDAVFAAAVIDGDAAGGDLTGTYPNPTLGTLVRTNGGTLVYLAKSAAAAVAEFAQYASGRQEIGDGTNARDVFAYRSLGAGTTQGTYRIDGKFGVNGAATDYMTMQLIANLNDMSATEGYGIVASSNWHPNADVGKPHYGILFDVNVYDDLASGNLSSTYYGGRFRAITRGATRTVAALVGGIFTSRNLTAPTVTTAEGGRFQNQADVGTIVTSYANHLQDGAGAGAITNNYGLLIDAMTKGGTRNIGIRIEEPGTSATLSAALYLASTSGNGRGGINFGADTILKRESSGLLSVRNAADSAYADFKADDVTGATLHTGTVVDFNGDTILKRETSGLLVVRDFADLNYMAFKASALTALTTLLLPPKTTSATLPGELFYDNVGGRVKYYDGVGLADRAVAYDGEAMGGDLTGTLPNPAIADRAVKNTQVSSVQGVLTFDPGGAGLTFPAGGGLTFGLTNSATGSVLSSDGAGGSYWAAAATSLPPSGAAGGELAGSYPNPTLLPVNVNRFGAFASRPTSPPRGTTYLCADLVFDAGGAGLTFPAGGGLTFGVHDGDEYLSDGSGWSLVGQPVVGMWLPFPFNSTNFGNVASTDQACEFMAGADGWVDLRGVCVNKVTMVLGTTVIGQLPPGSRPKVALEFPIYVFDNNGIQGTMAQLQIDTNGVLTVLRDLTGRAHTGTVPYYVTVNAVRFSTL